MWSPSGTEEKNAHIRESGITFGWPTNLWNRLPEQVADAPTLNCFKARLDKLWSEYRYCHPWLLLRLYSRGGQLLSLVGCIAKMDMATEYIDKRHCFQYIEIRFYMQLLGAQPGRIQHSGGPDPANRKPLEIANLPYILIVEVQMSGTSNRQ